MLARKDKDGIWQPWNGRNDPVARVDEKHTTAEVRFLDGRTLTIKAGEPFSFEPYDIVDTLTAKNVEHYSDADLAVYGIARVVRFKADPGMMPVGHPRYVLGKGGRVREEYDVAPIPPPAPPPSAEERFENLASLVGLTPDQLDEVLDKRAARRAERQAERQAEKKG